MTVRIKPKIVLDRAMLDEINEFYSARLGEEAIGLECFSDPKLNSHICNISALPENGQPCEYCKNVFGRQCLVTCHIHYFCLAVFAYRLGIGEKKRTTLKSSIKNNLKTLSYKKLYSLVMEILEEGKAPEGEKVQEKEQIDPPVEVPVEISASEEKKKPKKKRGKKKKEPVFDDAGVELITITQAAEIYECTYVNMYSHVRRGNVEKVVYNGMNYVRKKDVVDFKNCKKPSESEV